MTERPQIRIYLDLDGVLADFDPHLHAKGKAKEDGSPNWDTLDFEWWTTMPVCDGAQDFYREVRGLGETKFLTAPVPLEDCFAGKAHWLSHTFMAERGRYILNELIICPGVDKALMARPHHILVDDRIKNITEWREAGGIGVHHTGDFVETMRQVKEAVDTLGGPMPKVFKKAAKKQLSPK